MDRARHVGLALLLSASVIHAQYSQRDTTLAQRWWCEADRGHADGQLCRRVAYTDAIALATNPEDKIKKVDLLRGAIGRGEVQARGLDATNPERHQMMLGWCDSSDSSDEKSKKGACDRAYAHRDRIARRTSLIQFWCVEQGQRESAKCQQMQFDEQMSKTESGAERKRLAERFRASRLDVDPTATELETKQMMHAICASLAGKTELFSKTCAKIY